MRPLSPQVTRLFGGLERPVHEIRSTLRWLSPEKSAIYLHGDNESSFVHSPGDSHALAIPAGGKVTYTVTGTGNNVVKSAGA